MTPRRKGKPGRFELRPFLNSRHDAARGSDTPVAYEVLELPEGYSIIIGKFGARWQVLLQTPREIGRWAGDYSSPREALEAVQGQF